MGLPQLQGYKGALPRLRTVPKAAPVPESEYALGVLQGSVNGLRRDLERLAVAHAASCSQIVILREQVQFLLGKDAKFRAQPTRPGLDELLSLASLKTGVSVEEIMGGGRHKGPFQGRAVFSAMAVDYYYTLVEVGRALGGYHHTSVINLARRGRVMLAEMAAAGSVGDE
jgi:hypothetical protein